MNIGPICSDSKLASALSALGTNVLGQDAIPLLQQAVVAVGNITKGGGGGGGGNAIFSSWIPGTGVIFNGSTPAATGLIQINDTDSQGNTGWHSELLSLPPGVYQVAITGSSGTSIFEISSIADGGSGFANLYGGWIGGFNGNWSSNPYVIQITALNTTLRSTGTLQAYTTASSPAVIEFTVGAVGPGDIADLGLTINNSTQYYSYDNSGGGTIISVSEVVANLNSWMDGWVSAGLITYTSDPNSGSYVVTTIATGSSANLSVWSAYWSIPTSTTYGSDASGAILEVYLYSGNNSIGSVLMQNGYFDGNISGCGVQLYLRSGIVDTPLSLQGDASAFGVFQPVNGDLSAWMNGLNAGESLVAKLEATPPIDGSTCNVGVIFQATKI